MPLLIMTPVRVEFEHLSAFLDARDPGALPASTALHAYRAYPALDLCLARGGLGKAQFALQVQHLLDACPGISGVICAGTGGALAKDVRPGEIVVATETVEHDCKYRFAPHPLPRFPSDPGLLERIRQCAQKLDFRVHFGPVASGDEDIVDRKRAAAIRASTGALAVAWEGAGGARACAFSKIPYIEVRGVSDGADPLAMISFVLNLKQVMTNIGKMIVLI